MRNTIDVVKNMDISINEPRLARLVHWLDHSFKLDKDTKLEPDYSNEMLGWFRFKSNKQVCPEDTLVGVTHGKDCFIMPDIEWVMPGTDENLSNSIYEIFDCRVH